MSETSTFDDPKMVVGRTAADECVESGMRVGMGTGSTAVWAIRRIGERIAAGELRDIVAVTTSSQSDIACFRAGIPPTSLGDPRVGGQLDLVVDGADEVDRNNRLIKGGGAALLREKVCAYAAERVVICVTPEKHVEHLGLAFPVPLEVVPFALEPVRKRLRDRGFEVVLREGSGKMGPVVTDNGNYILDIRFGAPQDVVALETEVERVPGVASFGIFAARRFDIYTAELDGTITRTRA
ncbi:MAG: ribose 5-phosphate isomerase A [bacterium]